MHDYLAIVFDNTDQAYKGLHTLWHLDQQGDITIHGTAVVHRTPWGTFQVDSKDTHPAMATAIGVGVGALLGVFAGPVGVALGAAGGAAVGAAAGGLIGAGTDLVRADRRDEAAVETSYLLGRGKSAVIANVSEDFPLSVDARMEGMGGVVHRMPWTSLGDYFPDSYFYPYEYIPAEPFLS